MLIVARIIPGSLSRALSDHPYVCIPSLDGFADIMT